MKRPQHAGHQRPQAAADASEHDEEWQQDESRLIGERQRAGRGKASAHIKLALAADIDQADARR